MVTVCPMCQMNLDAYQSETNRFFGTNYHMPIVFFTQLMGFGIWDRTQACWVLAWNWSAPKKRLARIGVEVPAPAANCTREEAGRAAHAAPLVKRSMPAGRKPASRRHMSEKTPKRENGRLCLSLRHEHRRHGGC